MKRIKFDNLQYNWFFISLMVLSLICIILGTFEIIEFENQKINKGIRAFGFLSQFLFYSRMFFYKNYVQWNKRGLFLRINSFLGKSISFEDIKSSILEDKLLKISKKNGVNYSFDLNNIDENDSKKLNEIINQYCCK